MLLVLSLLAIPATNQLDAQDLPARSLRLRVTDALRRATDYYHGTVAAHGGYVYFYSEDLRQRWGEGPATPDQIWVQPPGTPTVGIALLRVYEATRDERHLAAARDAAEALVYGQLKSGGWTNCVDFDPRGPRVAQYRNGWGRGRNNSSLDDGQTQSAIRLLVLADEALRFEHARIHEAATIALDVLLAAQFPNGAFPQVWTGPVARHPIVPARYPDYDWRTQGRIKEYWTMYTLNDNVCGYVADTLIEAHRVYGDARYLAALKRLGDFLVLARMPEPQPGWAQQYNYEMHPIWARKFEPPAVSGDESREAIDTLITISRVTGDGKYLAPIPAALAWLERSVLPDGQLARYYELKTNRPLYMSRAGDVYSLTYDDSRLPSHYGWKTEARLDELRARLEAARQGRPTAQPTAAKLRSRVLRILDQLDDRGRWLDRYDGERLVGQPKFRRGEYYLSSETFGKHLTVLSDYLRSTD